MFRIRFGLACVAALAAIFAVVAAGVPARAQGLRDGLVPGGAVPDLILVSTGDVIGYLDTCGCKTNPSGGLHRRGWVIDQLRTKFPRAPLLLADSGNFSDIPTAEGDVKTRGLLEGMAGLGYSVVNVGERDIKQGFAAFARRAEGAQLGFVSSNLILRESGKPVFDPYAVVKAESPDGSRSLRIGVIGALRFNPLFVKPGPNGGEIVIAHPMETVRQAVQQLEEEKVDLTVLLAALHQNDVRKIVAQVPGIDFVIGSYGGAFTREKEHEGDTWLVYTGNQGQRVGVSRIFFGEDGSIADQTTRLHLLNKTYPAIRSINDFINDVHRKAKDALRAEAAVAGAGGSDKPTYVGNGGCKSCHAGAFGQWETTDHARAFETLQHEGKANSELCVGCHVTGLAEEGGYTEVAATPDRANVGCEACHGPGSRHLVDSAAKYGRISLYACTACHDPENSPEFDYYSYLPRVSHVDRPSR